MLRKAHSRNANMPIKKRSLLNPLLSLFLTVLLIMAVAPVSVSARQASVRVNAPEMVSGGFDVSIDIANIHDMDSGQFDLSFDPGVVKVTDIKAGRIAGTEVPIAHWVLLDQDTIRVLFNLPGVKGISGSGSLARICSRVTGKAGEISALNISGGLLVDMEANRIPASWLGDEVAVETSAPAPESAQKVHAEQTPGPEVIPEGRISISTPLAVAALVVLVAIHSLALVMYRRKKW
jgi:hypothetical protein